MWIASSVTLIFLGERFEQSSVFNVYYRMVDTTLPFLLHQMTHYTLISAMVYTGPLEYKFLFIRLFLKKLSYPYLSTTPLNWAMYVTIVGTGIFPVLIELHSSGCPISNTSGIKIYLLLHVKNCCRIVPSWY